MPWTRQQVKYLLSSASPLSSAQQDKMKGELHADPSLGHHKKGSSAMKAPFHHTHIQHHDDGSHTVTHTPHMKPASKSGAFMHAGSDLSYSAGDGHELVSKLKHNLNLKDAGSEAHETEASHEEMGGEAEMDES